MRMNGSLRLSLLFVFLASPVLLCAQFQAPTAEELKMTADPKAPGAAAVYLNLEDVTNDLLHFRSYYARIKVLTEKGKDLATIQIPYETYNFKITEIKGRTIHPDGAIVPLVVKPEDLLIVKQGDTTIDRKVLNLPSVEVGSIIEYTYQLDYGDYHFSSPFWEIQRPYFIHKARFVFMPVDNPGLGSVIWLASLPPGITLKTDVAGHYNLDLTDIPPSPQEEWMPPIKTLLYRVHFYYKRFGTTSEFWASQAKDWSKEVNHFTEATKSFRDTVSGLIVPGDSDLDKAKKLYAAVQTLDNTGFSRKKEKSEMKQLKVKEVKRVEDTWSQKSGSANDIALLYLAMLRAAGLNAYAMKIVDRDQGVFDPTFLYFDQLQDDLVILNVGGKDIVLDPGEKMCPFQTVHWKHSGASGIRQSDDDRAAAASPLSPYTANTINRIGEVTLDNHGAVSGHFSIVMTGQEALHWRQAALENDESEVKKQFDAALAEIAPDGVEAHVDHFLGLDDPDSNLLAMVTVQGALGSATSKRIFLPAFLFETRGHHPFVDEAKRQEAVDMHYAEEVNDQVVYHLPAGYTLEGAPQNGKIPWTGHAVLVSTFSTEPGQITVTRTLARAFTFTKPDEYQDLRGFYQKVAAADQQQLVLTTSASQKGN
jgi:hypothetical protein